MHKTVLALIATMVIIPVVFLKYGHSPSDIQLALIKGVGTVALVIALVCFFVSEIASNYSQVDKIWSLAPIAYCWHTVAIVGADPRLLLMSILVTIWGLRLSYNFGKKGGYSWKFWEGEEDYRWEVVRSKPFFNKRIVWTLFNFFFICLYQNALIFLFTTPIIASVAEPSRPLTLSDGILVLLALGMIIYESIADQQQWKFQNEKKTAKDKGNSDHPHLLKGFLDTGLWSKSRHPNYFAEQGFWVVFYFFSVTATGHWLNWSLMGLLLLLILFRSSSDMSESISASKYAGYKAYTQSIPRFIPKFY